MKIIPNYFWRYSPILTLSMLMLNINSHAQDAPPAVPVIKLSGYVKSDVFYDSRQTICAREGHFLLFPAAPSIDEGGRDLNARPGFNILPIQSNLSVNVNGPTTIGGAVSAVIEGDFFGQSNNDVNMLRLRHAYIKLQWDKTQLLVGQYWHPMFVTSCYPGTISFNTGSPISPFSRAPQIRISRNFGNLTVAGTLLSQRDYVSVGPEGPSSKYIRDSGMPEFAFSAELNSKNKKFTAGSVVGYKCLIPQTKTGANIKTDEKVSGFTANAYIKFVNDFMTVKLEGVYLENASELMSISGYAVQDTLDETKGLVNYTPVRTVSYWGDIQTNGKLFQAGLFSGYSENMGTRSTVSGPFYLMAGLPVKSLYRVSPRLAFKPGNLTFAVEIEFTSALYGSPDDHGVMINTARVNNTRILLSAIYKF